MKPVSVLRTLSVREEQVLAFISECRRGSPVTSPSLDEIANHFGFSIQRASVIVRSLEQKTVIRRAPNVYRSITLAEEHRPPE